MNKKVPTLVPVRQELCVAYVLDVLVVPPVVNTIIQAAANGGSGLGKSSPPKEGRTTHQLFTLKKEGTRKRIRPIHALQKNLVSRKKNEKQLCDFWLSK